MDTWLKTNMKIDFTEFYMIYYIKNLVILELLKAEDTWLLKSAVKAIKMELNMLFQSSSIPSNKFNKKIMNTYLDKLT